MTNSVDPDQTAPLGAGAVWSGSALFAQTYLSEILGSLRYLVSSQCRILIWATSWQNQQNGMCAQWRLRSAWASAQSDQSSLSAWRKLGSLATHGVHSEDSDQTGRMPRLIWVFAGHTCHFVGFVVIQLIHMFAVLMHWWVRSPYCGQNNLYVSGPQ